MRAAPFQRCDDGVALFLAVARFGGAIDFFRRRLPRDPVHTRGEQRRGKQFLVVAEQHGIIFGIFGYHIERAVRTHAETLALTRRVALQTAVAAEHAARFVDKVAGLRRDAAVVVQKAHIVPIGDEADVL